MKIIDGKKFYAKHEVAQMVGRSPQMVRLWDIWSDELEEKGKDRLIPKPMRTKANYRLWSEEDVEAIIEFSKNIKRGQLAEFSRRQWGERGKKKK